MAPDQERLMAEALELPTEARAELAGRLLESLDQEVDDDVEELWRAEIGRRVKELDAGTAKTVPWSEVQRQLLEQDETDR